METLEAESLAEEVAEVVAEAVAEAEEPPTPSPKLRKKVEMTTRPAPTVDADFWGGMLDTEREMDKAATRLRYSNLVVFK